MVRELGKVECTNGNERRGSARKRMGKARKKD